MNEESRIYERNLAELHNLHKTDCGHASTGFYAEFVLYPTFTDASPQDRCQLDGAVAFFSKPWILGSLNRVDMPHTTRPLLRAKTPMGYTQR